jgi:hypothetical protein
MSHFAEFISERKFLHTGHPRRLHLLAPLLLDTG